MGNKDGGGGTRAWCGWKMQTILIVEYSVVKYTQMSLLTAFSFDDLSI